MLSILWTILIGFIAGVIAKFVTPGSTHEPQGFILTAALGIVGALVATYLGQALGWYHAGQGAGFIASIVGAVLILLVWGPFWRSSVPAYAIPSPDIVSDTAYTICWTGVVSLVVCTSGARVCC